jgi:hypothetical protein
MVFEQPYTEYEQNIQQFTQIYSSFTSTCNKHSINAYQNFISMISTKTIKFFSLTPNSIRESLKKFTHF